VPEGQPDAAGLHIGRQTPLLVPASVPVGMTQPSPAAHPAQPNWPLQPEFCVQVAPTPPKPGQAQSVVSPEYLKQARPGAQPWAVVSVGSQGREQSEKVVLPQGSGTLQNAALSLHPPSSWQYLRQVITLQPEAPNVKHCEPAAQSPLLVQESPGPPAPAT